MIFDEVKNVPQLLSYLQGVSTCSNGQQMVMYRSFEMNSDLLFISGGIFVTAKKKQCAEEAINRETTQQTPEN